MANLIIRNFLTKFLTVLSSLISVATGCSIESSDGTLNYEVECSNIWNFFGSQIHMGQNEGCGNLGIYNFIPNSIQMKQGCYLTIQDDMGVFSGFQSTIDPGGQCWYRPISFACCECYGCSGAQTPVSETACAVLYDHADCSACRGMRFEVESGEFVRLVNPTLNDRVSSIIVKPGCELTIFKDPDFSGDAAIVTGIIETLLRYPEWDNQISSYQCNCNGGSPELPKPTTPGPLPSTTSGFLTPINTPITTIASFPVTNSPTIPSTITTLNPPSSTLSTIEPTIPTTTIVPITISTTNIPLISSTISTTNPPSSTSLSVPKVSTTDYPIY